MARKELGHIELHWQCPNCDGINQGREETCSSCGAPQPEDVEFKQFSHQELLKDQKLIERAKAGADIHCAYCGTRNPAKAQTCSQCGSDISEGTVEYIRGKDFLFEAEFVNNSEIDQVDFYLNGLLLGSRKTPPYLIPWEMQLGEYQLMIKAIDLAGNQAELVVDFNVNRD